MRASVLASLVLASQFHWTCVVTDWPILTFNAIFLDRQSVFVTDTLFFYFILVLLTYRISVLLKKEALNYIVTLLSFKNSQVHS